MKLSYDMFKGLFRKVVACSHALTILAHEQEKAKSGSFFQGTNGRLMAC